MKNQTIELRHALESAIKESRENRIEQTSKVVGWWTIDYMSEQFVDPSIPGFWWRVILNYRSKPLLTARPSRQCGPRTIHISTVPGHISFYGDEVLASALQTLCEVLGIPLTFRLQKTNPAFGLMRTHFEECLMEFRTASIFWDPETCRGFVNYQDAEGVNQICRIGEVL